MSEKPIEEFIEEIYGCAHPGHPLWIHVKQLLDMIEEVKAERDKALRDLAACKMWLKNRLPFNVAKSVDNACDIIEAARLLEEWRREGIHEMRNVRAVADWLTANKLGGE